MTAPPDAAPRMRILYSHRINSHDGQGVHVTELIRAFRAAGHEVTVVGPAFFEQAGFGGESRLVSRLRRYLPGILGELAEIAYNLPAYARLHAAYREQKPDFIYERCNLYFLAGAWLARRHKVRLCLEVNSPLAEERQRHGGLRLVRLARRLERFTWCSASKVFPVTAILGGILADAGVDPARIVVMPNGVDLSRFPPRPARRPDAPLILGFVGFVRAWHALDQVIAGMAASSAKTRLIIVGEGPAIADLQAQAATLGCADRVEFHGLVPPEDIGAVVCGFDIALQPSATAYASPLKIFDYMASGCAIVAPDQANIREVLTHEHDALLFAANGSGGFWHAVERLILDDNLRSRLGNAARQTLVSRDYTWSGNARRIVALTRDPD